MPKISRPDDPDVVATAPVIFARKESISVRVEIVEDVWPVGETEDLF
jgi:hypothetical protein